MPKRLANFLTLIIIIGVAYVGYRYFFVPPPVSDQPGVTVTTGGASSPSGEFLDLLLSVRNLSLSKRIFNNPVFRDKLVDYSRELPERVIGRENPFAPLGVGGTGTTTTGAGRAATTTATSTSATPSRSAAPQTQTAAPAAAGQRDSAAARGTATFDFGALDNLDDFEADFNF